MIVKCNVIFLKSNIFSLGYYLIYKIGYLVYCMWLIKKLCISR